MKNSPRAAAAQAIYGVVEEHRSLAATLPEALQTIPENQHALVQEISYGVLRQFHLLKQVANQLLSKPLKKRDQDLFALILVGLYQLSFMHTPSHAAISETVNATKMLGDKPGSKSNNKSNNNKTWARGLVNAVLRRFQREEKQLLENAQQTPEGKFSHPNWMIKTIQKQYPDQWENILHENNQRAPMTLRVNLAKTTRDNYLQQLANAGIEAIENLVAPTAITLQKPVSVAKLPGFFEGLVSVQDAAPQQAIALLNPQPGERILDACAAPGGKTGHLLEIEASKAEKIEIVALDHTEERLQKLRENLARLQQANNPNLSIQRGDAGKPDWWDGKPFNRILVDAPCSGSGVIRRNPDIKLLRRETDLQSLSAQQGTILENVWNMLCPGGTLLYATCSIFRQENEETIRHFLESHSDAQHQSITTSWGTKCDFGRQILSGEQTMDGFYYTKLIKRI